MSGKRARLERKNGTRKINAKTSVYMEIASNLGFDKELYRQRRENGVSGTPKVVRTYDRVQDDGGNDVLIPSSSVVSRQSSHLQRKETTKVHNSRYTKKYLSRQKTEDQHNEVIERVKRRITGDRARIAKKMELSNV